jgi:hypothetical protein
VKWIPILPIPVDALPQPEEHPTLGKAIMTWTYRDKDGQPLFYVNRFNTPDGRKETRPLSFCKKGDSCAWRWQGLTKPRPLYHLDKLAANPQATVIICEGEKAADAAGRLFPLPDHVVTTSPNGAQSPAKADWSHLEARTVWLWPDNDDSGRKYAGKVAELLKKAGARGIKFLHVPGDHPPGWDAADALAEGWQASKGFELLDVHVEQVNGAGEAKESLYEVVACLAALLPLEYDQRREEEAKKLGVRVSTLDKAVAIARKRKHRDHTKAAPKAAFSRLHPFRGDLGVDILSLVDDAISRLGYGGDRKPVVLQYLNATSRLLYFVRGNLLSHSQVIGPASGGKNYLIDTALALLPKDSFLKMDASTPKALIYHGGDLKHRVVFFTEVDSLPLSEGSGQGLGDGDSRSTAASAIRSLLSEGELSFFVVERDPETGNFVTKQIHKPGPTVLLTTTTKAIKGQLGTRLWEMALAESDEQITKALKVQAARELYRESYTPVQLIEYQGHLQDLAPWDVIIPYADELVDSLTYKGMDTRIQRDYQRILALIKSVTVLRHHLRNRDSNDRWGSDG